MCIHSNSTTHCTSTSTSTSTSKGPAERRRIAAIEKTETLKKSVQFNEDCISAVHIFDRQDNIESTTTSWLDLKDMSEIRHGIYRTLDLVNFGAPSIMYCVRGLEEYSTGYEENFGCLKSSAIHRRQTAMRAVLYEQDRQQRQNYMKTKAQRAYNTQRIRKVSESFTSSNVQYSISMGSIDSEEALLVYIEHSQQQQHTKRTSSKAACDSMCKQQQQHAPNIIPSNDKNLLQFNPNKKIWNFETKSHNLDAA